MTDTPGHSFAQACLIGAILSPLLTNNLEVHLKHHGKPVDLSPNSPRSTIVSSHATEARAGIRGGQLHMEYSACSGEKLDFSSTDGSDADQGSAGAQSGNCARKVDAEHSVGTLQGSTTLECKQVGTPALRSGSSIDSIHKDVLCVGEHEHATPPITNIRRERERAHANDGDEPGPESASQSDNCNNDEVKKLTPGRISEDYSTTIGSRIEPAPVQGDYSTHATGSTAEAAPVGDLCIRGLAWCTTEESLHTYFSQFGEVSLCAVKREPDGRSKGYGFINFRNVSAVDRVLQQVHIIDNREVEVRPPRERQEPPAPQPFLENPVQTSPESTTEPPYRPLLLDPQLRRKVFVGLLPACATDEQLLQHFSLFGKVHEVFLPKPNRGFAFITYEEEGSAYAALEADEHKLHGVHLQVKSATPKNPPLKALSTNSSRRPTSPSGSCGSGSSVASAPPGRLFGKGQGSSSSRGASRSRRSQSGTNPPAEMTSIGLAAQLQAAHAAHLQAQMSQLQLQAQLQAHMAGQPGPYSSQYVAGVYGVPFTAQSVPVMAQGQLTSTSTLGGQVPLQMAHLISEPMAAGGSTGGGQWTHMIPGGPYMEDHTSHPGSQIGSPQSGHQASLLGPHAGAPAAAASHGAESEVHAHATPLHTHSGSSSSRYGLLSAGHHHHQRPQFAPLFQQQQHQQQGYSQNGSPPSSGMYSGSMGATVPGFPVMGPMGPVGSMLNFSPAGGVLLGPCAQALEHQHQQQQGSPMCTTTPQLFVSNLHFSTTWSDLIEIFRPYGNIVRAVILYDDKRQPRGKATVTFQNVMEASSALLATHGQMVKGRKLAVKEDTSNRL